jgi:hypothetical protein
MNARLGRVILVVALLLAQRVALAHELWHFAAGTRACAAAAIAAPEQAPAQSRADRLCDFHSALGTVLGALSGAAALTLPAAPLDAEFLAPALPPLGTGAPVPASRDPPAARL